ncbi:MAG: response regulator [Candidatus Omnitrophica bacterium]|nr:response regulator [Candidatus Omnitrophota bacterium]
MVKLLVVDDEADICDFVQKFFKERHFNVFVAYNGEDALDIIQKERPKILLLDMKMPVMNGIETLKAIRERGDDIKVIMVTAINDIDVAKEARKCGASEYITKPLVLEQLEKTVLAMAKRIKMDTCG